MKKEIDRSKLKIIGFSLLGVASCATAISVPFALESSYEKQQADIDFSDSKIGNTNRINYFLSNYDNVDSSKLINQLKIKEKYSYVDRSFVTVNEAWNNGWFEFKLYSSFEYSLYKNNLEAELAYVKPSETNSTYPVVGLRIFAGSGSTYSERIFEYGETNVNGFKQSNEEINTNNIISDINKNPNKYFVLNENIGKIGDLGLYAKNIKISDFDLIKNNAIIQIEKYNYFIQISSVDYDKVIPSNLNITYSIEFNDGNISFKKTYQKITLSGFDIEMGKDDPISKVENFIKNNSSDLNALKQFFKLNVSNDVKDITIRSAYENGWIEFNPTSNNVSSLTNQGLSIEFKEFIPGEEKDKLNVFSKDDNSQTPMYRIYITSYKNTPLEYTKDYIIEGDENTRYLISDNQKSIDKFNEILNKQNLLYERFFEFNQIIFSQDGPFKGKQLNEVPFVIVKSAFDKWKEDSKKYKQPFKLTISINQEYNNDQLFNELSVEDKQFVTDLLPKIVDTFNKIPLSKQLNEINLVNGNYELNANIGLGENENNLFLSIDSELPLLIPNNLFMDKDVYYSTQVDKVFQLANTNKNFIKPILASSDNSQGQVNEFTLIECMKKGEWEKLFESNVVILNMPQIEYPDYDSNIVTSIIFEQFNSIYPNNEAVENDINLRQIKIPISISKENVFKTIEITINFDNLFIK